MRFLKLFMVLLFIALPLAAFAAEKKANSIDELAKMYDSSSCKKCHAEIYAQWEKSHHARRKGRINAYPACVKKRNAGQHRLFGR